MTQQRLPNRRGTGEFDRMWNAPNTMHLVGTTIAVYCDADGARLLLHHGGTTQAIKLDRQQADTLAAALRLLDVVAK